MGLGLPAGKLLAKVLYTSLEFGLILFAAIAGGWGIRFFPALYLVLVIRSCLIFRPTGRLIVAGLAFMSFLLMLLLKIQLVHSPPLLGLLPEPALQIDPTTLPRGEPFRSRIQPEEVRFVVVRLILSAALLFGLVLTFVLMLINTLLTERQSREKLAIAHDKLRNYALRIENQAALQERNRIAREIHDSLGHLLTAQSIQLENAITLWQSNTQKAQTFLTEAKHLGSNALQEVRQSIATLRSDPLKGQSLESAIARLVKDFQRTTNIVPDCTINLGHPLSTEVSTATYRIVQEALTNIYKHSAATQVTIRLQANTEVLFLLVEDNGTGFNPDQNTTGFGLQGMRERTAALGGQLNIISQPGAGCRITAYIPWSKLPL